MGQDVLTLGPAKVSPQDIRDRRRIAEYVHDFYLWLVKVDFQEDYPDIVIHPEAHILTGTGGQGFAVYIPSQNLIVVAIRGKHEATTTFREAFMLCCESAAHEFAHFLQITRKIKLKPKYRKGRRSESEEHAERYARRMTRKYFKEYV